MFKGEHVGISQLWCISVPDDCFYINKQCRLWWNLGLRCVNGFPVCVWLMCHNTKITLICPLIFMILHSGCLTSHLRIEPLIWHSAILTYPDLHWFSVATWAIMQQPSDENIGGETTRNRSPRTIPYNEKGRYAHWRLILLWQQALRNDRVRPFRWRKLGRIFGTSKNAFNSPPPSSPKPTPHPSSLFCCPF